MAASASPDLNRSAACSTARLPVSAGAAAPAEGNNNPNAIASRRGGTRRAHAVKRRPPCQSGAHWQLYGALVLKSTRGRTLNAIREGRNPKTCARSKLEEPVPYDFL